MSETPRGGADRAELVDDPPVRGLAVADGEDDRVATHTCGLLDVDDDERLEPPRVERVRDGPGIADGVAERLPDPGRVARVERDDRERLLRPGEGVVDDQVDDVLDLVRHALDDPTVHRQSPSLDDVEADRGGTRDRRDRDERALVPVSLEEGREREVTVRA
ncbi:hypothetical protein [Salana multivorans]